MKSKISTTALALALIVLASCSRGYETFTGYAQGGTYSVKANLKGVKISSEEIGKTIDSLLVTIDSTLSGYNKASQLSRFNAGDTLRPGKLFIETYDKAAELWRETGGGLDCAGGPLFDAWGFGFTADSLPSDKVVDSLLNTCGMKRLRPRMEDALGPDGSLSPKDLLLPRYEGGSLPELNFNAIAQGLSCDVIASYLYSLGVKDMLVDIGEIFCDGLNPQGRPWTIGVDKPFDGNETPGKDLEGIWRSSGGPSGIVTSGNYRKFYVRDGKKFAHTIDPRTGRPVSHSLLSATIVAPDALTADAMATYCMVIGLDSAKAFIDSRDDLEAWLIYSGKAEGELIPEADTTMKTWASPGFINQ